MSRSVRFATLGLLFAGLSVVSNPSPAAAEIFKPRWCADKPTPCLESATRNGVPFTAADPDIEVTMVGTQNTPDAKYTHFIVQAKTGTLDLSDTFSLTFDLGKLQPDYTESYTSRPDVDRIDDGDGTHHARITGRPVLLTYGCNDNYPSVCPKTADGENIEFSGEIHQLKTNLDLVGFDRSQSVDSVNGIFLVNPPSGAPYLTSDWANSHYLSDGTTVVRGEARFRMPYAMLRSDFGIPDPGTMVASSLIGSINGNPASFDFAQDPGGGAVFVDIAGVTFSRKTIKVKRGAITPTKPKLEKVKRPAARKAKVYFDRSKARGAKVKSYQARCVSGKHVRSRYGNKSAFKSKIVVKGLKGGKKYKCSVRAKSKAGPSKWSKAKKV